MTAFLIVVATGCRKVNNTLYIHYADLEAAPGRPIKPVSFEPWPADSAWNGHRMDLTLMVRYREHLPMAPLRLIAAIEDAEGEIRNDTLTIDLFDNQGNPRIDSRFGICEWSDTLLHDFTLRPGLSVCLTPLNSAENTKGVLNIGIKLSSHELVSAKH